MKSLASLLFILLFAPFIMGGEVSVSTELGTIVGHSFGFKFDGTTHTITRFLGIPFAEPPTAEQGRRFEKPVKKAAFTETFFANKSAPWCFQNPAGIRILFGVDPETLPQSEDCLYLNIYVPGTGDINQVVPRAVIIWIYGGGYQQGTQDWYDATTLVALKDVILVTLNYRVSALGFLSSPDNGLLGNNGLWDQQMAIEWVQDHIRNFGGNPSKITIAGESAGASSVVYQTLYEGNEGLFQNVIAQSGSINSGFAYEKDPNAKFLEFANMVGCAHKNEKQIIKCMKEKDVNDLIAPIEFDTVFKPVVDNQFVTTEPAEIFLNKTTESWTALKRFGKRNFIFCVNSADGALFMGFLSWIFGSLGENPDEIELRNRFENEVLPFAMSFAQLELTEPLKQAIIQQYLNWSNPADVVQMIQKSVDLISDTSFNAPILQSAMAHYNTEQNGRLFVYVFDHKLPLKADYRYNGANHEDEMMYVLGMPKGRTEFMYQTQLEDLTSVFESWKDVSLSMQLMEYWSNFVKTGDPNGETGESSLLTTWPEYNYDSQNYIHIDGGCDGFPIEQRYLAGRINFWHNLAPFLKSYYDEVCDSCPKIKNEKKAKKKNADEN